MNKKDHSSQQQLEERITYCEQLADALNEVFTDLQKRVLSLEQQNRHLLAEIQQQQTDRMFQETNQTPPHY